MSQLGGGDFLKGALGAGLGNLAGGYVSGMDGMSNLTGNAMLDNYLAKALPNLAASETNALVNNRDLGSTGITSLLNTGVNMGTTTALNNLGLQELPTSVQPYATGIASNLITSGITGKPTNLETAIMNTALQQALRSNKMAAKP
jgi:hypothetical protein